MRKRTSSAGTSLQGRPYPSPAAWTSPRPGWGLEGAEAVLKLRALIANGDFDTYFAWRLRREFQRVHRARYQDRLSLAA